MKDKPTRVYRDHNIEELKRLRYWFAGFEAAGGKLSLCVGENMLDALRKAQILLESVETKP